MDAARARHGAGGARAVRAARPTRTRRRRSTGTAASRSSWRARLAVTGEPLRQPLRAAGRARGRGARAGASPCSSGRSRAPIPTTTPTTTWSGAASCSTASRRRSRPTPRRPSTRSTSRSAPCWALVFGESADRALVLVCLLSHARSCSAPTGSARRCSGAGAARWRALFVAASASFLLYAARGYVDAPFLALVVWAGVLRGRGRAAVRPSLLVLAGPAAPRGVGADGPGLVGSCATAALALRDSCRPSRSSPRRSSGR